MNTKVDYFIKNYLLNFSFSRPDCKIGQAAEGQDNYVFDVKAGGRNINIKISKNIIDEVFDNLSAYDEYRGLKPHPVNEPIVDRNYQLFTDALNAAFKMNNIDISAARKLKSFNICLTHDVDALRKNNFTTARFLAVSLISSLKKLSVNGLNKAVRYLSRSSDFNQIPNIIDMEASFGFKSTFFFYSKAEKALRQMIAGKFIDPLYDISDKSFFEGIFNLINHHNFEIGLHSSVFSARDNGLIEREAGLLKKHAGSDVRSNRSHFLKFSLDESPLALEKAGIKIDATFYYNRECGFQRHKTCSPFYMYSHKEKRILDLVEVPTVVMDSTLFNHSNATGPKAYRESIDILEKVRSFGAVAAINWHNETASPEYGWHCVYKDILNWIKANNGTAMTISEVYERLMR